MKDNMPLWAQLFWGFRVHIARQWSATLLSNFFDVAPAFATLQLLKYLETRTDPTATEPGAWKYVVGIAAATTSSHLIDSRIMWWIMSGMFNFEGVFAYTNISRHRYRCSAAISSYRPYVQQSVEDIRLKQYPRRSRLVFDLSFPQVSTRNWHRTIVDHDRALEFLC
jgi:hypothetical protein